ncbi:dihydrouridine synthase family protein, partial [Vibrio parahaemolyticus V-223/04]
KWLTKAKEERRYCSILS